MCTVSFPFNAQKSEPSKPRDGVDPRGKVPEEGMKFPSGAYFHG